MNRSKLSSSVVPRLRPVLVAAALAAGPTLLLSPAASAEELPPAVVCTYTVDQPDGWGGTRAFSPQDMFEDTTWLPNGSSVRAYQGRYNFNFGQDLRLREMPSGQVVTDDHLTRERNCR